jgi:RNA polymerase sigma-70 factor (ECF subfamily)
MADNCVAMDVAQLVQEYHQGVYRYAYRLTGSAADAEDLTQQVFLTAQEKLGQLRKAESAQSWLFAILRNCFLKEKQKHRPVPAGDLGFEVDHIPADLPEDEGIDPERLQAAINDLPETFRLVLAMFYFENCHYREIAERLNVPIGTVMSRLARAKAHLRSRLFEPEGQATSGHGSISARQRG